MLTTEKSYCSRYTYSENILPISLVELNRFDCSIWISAAILWHSPSLGEMEKLEISAFDNQENILGHIPEWH